MYQQQSQTQQHNFTPQQQKVVELKYLKIILPTIFEFYIENFEKNYIFQIVNYITNNDDMGGESCFKHYVFIFNFQKFNQLELAWTKSEMRWSQTPILATICKSCSAMELFTQP